MLGKTHQNKIPIKLYDMRQDYSNRYYRYGYYDRFKITTISINNIYVNNVFTKQEIHPCTFDTKKIVNRRQTKIKQKKNKL